MRNLNTRFVGNAADSYKAVRSPNTKPKLSPSAQGQALTLTLSRRLGPSPQPKPRAWPWPSPSHLSPSSHPSQAQRVFRTLVLAEASAKSNFGRYRPPDTVRVAEAEEEEAGGLQAVDKVLRSLGRRGSQVLHLSQSCRLSSARAGHFRLEAPSRFSIAAL